MVSKQCVACQGYFQGVLNGDYLCPACVAAGRSPLRPLASLDSLAAQSAGSRKPSASGADSFSKSQAA